jgi:hypothetical protein
MPLGTKFRKLRDLKRGPDGEPYSLSEIANESSRLYRAQQISRVTEQLQADGASMEQIAQACEEIRAASDAVNRQYLTDLRDGKKKDVTWRAIEALSLFFDVPTDFWRIGAEATEATRSAEEQVEAIAAMRDLLQHLDSATESDGEGVPGDSEAIQLLGALARGGQQVDPAQFMSFLRLAVQAIPKPPETPSG